jgi:hypothetical protein
MIKKLLFIFFLGSALVGYSQAKSIDKLAAAPNPFTNNTNITFTTTNTSTIILNVRNVLGKVVFKKSYKTKIGKNTITFYKNDLATGIYVYSIQDKKKIISKRFVIQ